MNEIIGNFWDAAPQFDALICTTNGVLKKDGNLVMGAGIALQFKKKWPALPKIFGHAVKINGVHSCLYKHGTKTLISMPTKYNFWEKSDINLLLRSAQEINSLLDTDIKTILVTRPGCGNGGLEWERDVKPNLSKIWDNRFTVISNE